MELQGYGVVEARPTFAHVGYLSAQIWEFVDPTPVPAYVAGTSVAALMLCLLTGTLAYNPRLATARRVALGVLALLSGVVWVTASGIISNWDEHDGDPKPEVLQTLIALEQLTAEADQELRGAAPDEAWMAAWRARGLADGWGKPLVIEARTVVTAETSRFDGRQYAISSVHRTFLTSTPLGSTPALASWMLGRDGRFGTSDDTQTMAWIAIDTGVDRRLNDPAVLRKLAARVERAKP